MVIVQVGSVLSNIDQKESERRWDDQLRLPRAPGSALRAQEPHYSFVQDRTSDLEDPIKEKKPNAPQGISQQEFDKAFKELCTAYSPKLMRAYLLALRDKGGKDNEKIVDLFKRWDKASAEHAELVEKNKKADTEIGQIFKVLEDAEVTIRAGKSETIKSEAAADLLVVRLSSASKLPHHLVRSWIPSSNELSLKLLDELRAKTLAYGSARLMFERNTLGGLFGDYNDGMKEPPKDLLDKYGSAWREIYLGDPKPDGKDELKGEGLKGARDQVLLAYTKNDFYLAFPNRNRRLEGLKRSGETLANLNYDYHGLSMAAVEMSLMQREYLLLGERITKGMTAKELSELEKTPACKEVKKAFYKDLEKLVPPGQLDAYLRRATGVAPK